jgi:hypothetical protein
MNGKIQTAHKNKQKIKMLNLIGSLGNANKNHIGCYYFAQLQSQHSGG